MALTQESAAAPSGRSVRLVDRVKGTWLTCGGGKFSTSRGRGSFLNAALRELPSDWWRWWLTADAWGRRELYQ